MCASPLRYVVSMVIGAQLIVVQSKLITGVSLHNPGRYPGPEGYHGAQPGVVRLVTSLTEHSIHQ